MENKNFILKTNFKPSGDQPQAIKELYEGLEQNKKHQVLLGATGTGKTFTMANIIEKYNKQTLVLAHNKTLALQLYMEFKELFPENRVEYYVSNFDYYQPEAYLPSKDLYIDKDSKVNQELEMMRLSAMNALVLRSDTIVVASVASIYATQNPTDYSSMFLEFKRGQVISFKQILLDLVDMGYKRNDIENEMGTFSVKGDVIKIAPGYTNDMLIRISTYDDEIESINFIERLNNKVLDNLKQITIYPAIAYVTNRSHIEKVVKRIGEDLEIRLKELGEQGKALEANRLDKRTRYDMETLLEFGICSGIENYAMYLDDREPQTTPYSLMDYFQKDFLTIIDESHMMIPQVRGMFNTDKSRKTTLVEYGFRLPSAMENRPLNFDEFENKLQKIVYTSATPGDYELEKTDHNFVQQIIRPTGLLDPVIEVRSEVEQIHDIIREIKLRAEKNERVIITTLTIRSSEDLTSFLQSQDIKVAYIHSELKTLERNQILMDLRKGVYDTLVGVNLLREGIDLPEVSLVCILEADKQGFLRNTRSLIQTVGRAARNANGKVIFYADKMSPAMQETINETNRRRKIQEEYNLKNNIIPTTIVKKISESTNENYIKQKIKNSKNRKQDLSAEIDLLRQKMVEASRDWNFEEAARIRDLIIELNGEKVK